MIWLSRLKLHPRDPLVLRDVGDWTQLHRTVMSAFPQHDGPTPRAHFGVLFRVEPRAGAEPPVVLVQSQVEPDWSSLPEGYTLACDVRDASALLDTAVPGGQFAFRLTANATKKVAALPGDTAVRKHSARVALLAEDAQLDWLQRRAALAGFSAESQDIRVSQLAPTGGSGRSAVTVQPVQFDGRLTVEDPDAFKGALRDGIGPAKAYGCGLLSLARPR
ncbi:MAG: type I-E CRISPR-associated protein Cas6/Cse3/CasE [Patulibacter sp.]